ncbi:MAG: hypothetical protein F6K58_16715 [Symploca sp. SIO2E9]|nr:hypothetical protein [Symploca sp. SIO2E9]
MGRWGDGEMGRWGDGEMGGWGDGEMNILPSAFTDRQQILMLRTIILYSVSPPICQICKSNV